MPKLEDPMNPDLSAVREGRPNILMIFSDEHHWQCAGY